jgi:hypothetical protein
VGEELHDHEAYDERAECVRPTRRHAEAGDEDGEGAGTPLCIRR